jgi:Uma2 family endonuclease
MSTIVVDTRSVHIPQRVDNLEGFRRWARSADFRDAGRVCYLAGEVGVDMSKEQFAHNQLKGEIAAVLTALVKTECFGRFFPDGYLLSNPAADLSTKPDGMFVETASLRAGRVRLVEGTEEGYVELEGTPDMVLELISPGSVEKDTVVLRYLYWQAEVPEYWLVDPCSRHCEVTILRRAARGFCRLAGGWLGPVRRVRQSLPADAASGRARLARIHAACSLNRAFV